MYEKLEDFIKAVQDGTINPEDLEIWIDNDDFHVYEGDKDIYNGFPDFELLLTILLPKAKIEHV